MNLSGLGELLPGAPPPVETYYRMVDARYASAIDETSHTVLHSWRYNPKGEFGVLYLSVSRDCAYQEKLRQVHGRREALPAQAVGAFRFHSSRCLDLTAAACREKLRVGLGELTDTADFSATQAIARQARRIGFEALIAPSAVGGACHSLVVRVVIARASDMEQQVLAFPR